MPNWVTNHVRTSEEVISALLNDKGDVDFNLIAPFAGKFNWDVIYGDTETAAEMILKRPLNSHPMMVRVDYAARENVDIKKMSNESFEQLIGMLRNFRECGYLHNMEFARDVWGTKWNACMSQADAAAGTAQFDTAWACPFPIFVALSKQFPSTPIEIDYADEDIGFNCGRFILLNGDYTDEDIAPGWPDCRDMSDEQKQKWKAFAYAVKGWEPKEED